MQPTAYPFGRLIGPFCGSNELDGVDPAYAPGVSHPEASGFLNTGRDLDVIKATPDTAGLDIVELNPDHEINQPPANLAARLVKELAALMLEHTYSS